MESKTDNVLAARSRAILDKFPKYKTVPRNPALWAGYLKDLRKNVLGLTQQEFWNDMQGINKITGSKYENLGGTSLSRRFPEVKMQELLELLNLNWEKRRRFFEQTTGGIPTANAEARKILDLIEHHKMTFSDFEKLLAMHLYYTKCRKAESLEENHDKLSDTETGGDIDGLEEVKNLSSDENIRVSQADEVRQEQPVE